MEKKEYRKRNKEKEKSWLLVKVLFFGTALISKVYLKELYKNNYNILIVTVPDRPSLRGQKVVFNAVKIYALENNISFIQSEEFNGEVIDTIKNFAPDVGIAVSYGKLIPSSVFLLPKYRTFNIHFSLLPKYKGASPVQYALCDGETKTGVTSFYIEEAFDSGDIIIQKKITIDIKDNAKTLFNKLIFLGIEVMNTTIDLLQNGKVNAMKQIGEPSLAPVLKKKDGLINWSKSAYEIYNQFRGLYIWPGIYSIVSQGKLVGKRIRFIDVEVLEKESLNKNFGTVYSIEKNKGFTVTCAIGKILVIKLQPENKSVMSAWSFIQGRYFSGHECF